MKQASTWAIFLLALTLVVSCGTRRPGTTQDPTTTSDPSEPVDTSDPSGTTDPADPSNTGTACESNDDCAPGICGEDGTCQPRDLACFSDADCFDDEYCAFPSGVHPTIPPWLARVHLRVLGPRSVHSGKNVSMVGALVITIATPLPTAATAPQMKCVTAKPGPVTPFQVCATSVSSARVIGSAIAATCAST